MAKTIEPLLAQDPKVGTVHAGWLITLDDNVSYMKKVVTKSKHFFKIVNGYGVQQDLYLTIRHKIAGILIQEMDTGRKLYATITTWDAKGKNGDWGNGKQKTLSEKYMKIIIK